MTFEEAKDRLIIGQSIIEVFFLSRKGGEGEEVPLTRYGVYNGFDEYRLYIHLGISSNQSLFPVRSEQLLRIELLDPIKIVAQLNESLLLTGQL